MSALVIALAETRELDRLAAMLESDGATTWRCPLLAIVDAADPRPVDAWLDTLARGGFDDLVFLTGEGVRRLIARATALGRAGEVVAAIGRARRITRGPKPAQALRELGLSTDAAVQPPTTEGVITTLAATTPSVAGRRVGVQLYGTDPNERLMRALAAAGAQATPVAPYAYASASDEEKVVTLLFAMADGRVSLIVFTSAGQLAQLTTVAEKRGLGALLGAALARTAVAAIGPVVVDALTRAGVRVDVVPEAPFVMRRLSKAIAAWARGARSGGGSPPGGATPG